MTGLPARAPGLAFFLLASLAAQAQTQAEAEAEAEAAIDVVLQAHAVVDGDRVTLRDLVVPLRVADTALDRLLSTDLGPAPRIDQPAHIDRARLQDWIRVRQPRLAGLLRWGGAPTTEVERASQDLPVADLDALARSTLEAWLRSRTDRFEIRSRQDVAPIRLPLGTVHTTVRPLSPIGCPASRMSVWVDVSVDGRFERAVVLGYEVKALRQAWVASDELARGQDLDDTRAAMAEVDIASASQALWSGPIARARMRNPAHRGQVLTIVDVEERPTVARGDWVAVDARKGELSIETNAEALQDGRQGQSVLVRIATSSAPISARVVGPGMVEIN